MERFSYHPIDLEGPNFRLVRLFKGDKEPIECELIDAWLSDPDDIIEYEALSYTWGSTDRPNEIRMDGKTLPVTENLYLALQHLRSSQKDRILWIDAICINQSNDKERGHQVQQMASIYKRAVRVLIWLGESTPETDIAFHYMQQLHNRTIDHVCIDWDATDVRWKHLWSIVQQQPGNTDVRYRVYIGLDNLLKHPWFQRIWIIQEIANARSANVICGTKSVSARTFAIVPSLVGLYPTPQCQGILDIMPGTTRRTSWWSQNRELYTLLCKFRDSHASDPRDLVYALLGISSDVGKDGAPLPDYEKSNSDVARDTAAYILQSSNWKYDAPEHLHRHLYGHPNTTTKLPDLFPWRIPVLLAHIDNLYSLHLLWAAEHGHSSVVQALFDTGKANANFEDLGGRTPVFEASLNGHSDIVQMFLKRNDVQLDLFDDRTLEVVSQAASRGYDQVVRLLLKEKNNIPDKNGRTPLWWAVHYSEKAAVNALLGIAKVSIYQRDHDGQTPLSQAVERKDNEITALILGRIGLEKPHDKTPLWWAAHDGQEAVVKLLLDTNMFNVNYRDKSGKTALLQASENGHVAVVERLLLGDQINVNLKRYDEESPLSRAASLGHRAIVANLLAMRKIKVNILNNEGQSPLYLAQQSGHEEVVRLLRSRGGWSYHRGRILDNQ